jgi:arylsulfatase A-like enzyme
VEQNTNNKQTSERQRKTMSDINVLFLCADDHRADALSAAGHPTLKTPHLDRLAREGAHLTHCFTTVPICTPARAELLTGCDAFTCGVRWFGETIRPELTLLPQAFANAGYRTFFSGKWHNDGTPDKRGYQQTRRVKVGGMWSHQLAFEENGRTVTGFSSELFAEAGIDFIHERAGNAQPFFCHIAFTAPHDPRTPPPAWRPDPKTLSLPPNFLPEHPFDNGEMTIRDELLEAWPRTPDSVRNHLADYYGMVAHMDAQIGRLLNALEETGQAKKTLVVYTGDHGLAVGSHGLMGKMSMYDHSVRVPLLLRGPNIKAGVRTGTFCESRDLYPTLTDLCGIPVPPTVQGKSLAPIVSGKSPTAAHRDTIYGSYRDVQRMIRTDRWKYIEYPKIGRSQLFDLTADPHELRDLLLPWRWQKTQWFTPDAVQETEIRSVAAEMASRLKAWQQSVRDPLVN